MKCPADGSTLLMADRQGIEIDYCPECRGVWLDRGELDKLVEREQSRGDDRGGGAGEAPKPKKKKKMSSFLQDVMELGQG
jgi:Zn-finger nucleic acid-binding protein